jgi:hypothetical protein
MCPPEAQTQDITSFWMPLEAEEKAEAPSHIDSSTNPSAFLPLQKIQFVCRGSLDASGLEQVKVDEKGVDEGGTGNI